MQPGLIRLSVLAAIDAGLKLSVDGEGLRIRGPKAAAFIANHLRRQEAEVIDYLEHHACPHCLGPIWFEESRRRGCCSTCFITRKDVAA